MKIYQGKRILNNAYFIRIIFKKFVNTVYKMNTLEYNPSYHGIIEMDILAFLWSFLYHVIKDCFFKESSHHKLTSLGKHSKSH